MQKLIAFYKDTFRYILDHKILLFLSLAIAVNNFLFTFLNGNYICRDGVCGIGINAALFHDPIWHIALANTAFKTIPFQVPVFAGYQLQGYHFLYDFVLYLFSLTGIPIIFLYWKVMPFIFTLLFIPIAIAFARSHINKASFVASFLFFSYFGGSFAYLATIYNKTFHIFTDSQTLFQPNTLILGPNVAFSVLVFLYVMYLLKKGTKNFFLLAVLVFIALGLKFYAGVLLFILLASYETLQLLSNKDGKNYLKKMFFYCVGVVSALFVFYNPFKSLHGDPVLQFSPFAMTQNYIEVPSLYYNDTLVRIKYLLAAGNDFSPRLLLLQLAILPLFFAHHFGMKIFGVVFGFGQLVYKKLSALEIAYLITLIFSCIMPVLFIQRGQWWDILQFMYYAMLISAYFTAKLVSNLLQKKSIVVSILIALMIVLSLPDTVNRLMMVFSPYRIISTQKLGALSFLKKQPNGAIFTIPYDREFAIVPAFSGKPVYYGDEGALNVTGIDYSKRKKEVEDLMQLDFSKLPVKYFYLEKTDAQFAAMKNKLTKAKYKHLFENNEVVVFGR